MLIIFKYLVTDINVWNYSISNTTFIKPHLTMALHRVS